jgi:peptidoglycan/LPS O-acetylase OafA/YrhL
MSERLYYVDWLRIIAFAILIVYHCSVAFFPDMGWLVKSTQTNQVLSWLMDFPRAWRLALLFFVSGMGTWFAFRTTPGWIFLRDRTVRLLVPLLFAMCVVVVPQVWLERVMEDGYGGSFVAFWVERYFTEGKYPTGNFTWAHMWFVAYLLVMALGLYPFFRLLTEPRWQRVSLRFESLARSWAVYAFFLLPLALNLALTPVFPRQTNALYNDGAWFAAWASWFGLGFLFARHHRAVIASIVERRWVSATSALSLTALLYAFCFLPEPETSSSIGSWEQQTPIFKVLIFALAWTMILSAIGFGARHLNRASTLLSWLNDRIFSLYIVHQTVIVWALYYVLPTQNDMWIKLLIVVSGTTLVSFALATLAEHLPWPLRLLFGAPRRAAPKGRLPLVVPSAISLGR